MKTLVCLVCLIVFSSFLSGEELFSLAEADEKMEEASKLLTDSTVGDMKIVDSAFLYKKLRIVFAKAEKWDEYSEASSGMFWAKKKMTNDQLSAFLARSQGLAYEVPEKTDDTKDTKKTEVVVVDDEDFFANIVPEEAVVKEVSKAAQGTWNDFCKRRDVEINYDDYTKMTLPKSSKLIWTAAFFRKEFKLGYKTKQKLAFANFLFAQACNSVGDPVICKALLNETIKVASDKKANDIWTLMRVAEFINAAFDGCDIEKEYKKNTSNFSTIFSDEKSALETWIKNKDDKEASFILGRAFAFLSFKYEDGMKFMLNGSDKEFSNLAKKDLANPTNAIEQRALGDLFVSISSKKENKRYKEGILKRAVYWYNKSISKKKNKSLEKSIKKVSKKIVLDPSAVDYSNLQAWEWDKLDAKVEMVSPQKLPMAQTKTELKPSFVYRIVPHPNDKWIAFGVESDYKGVDRYDAMSKSTYHNIYWRNDNTSSSEINYGCLVYFKNRNARTADEVVLVDPKKEITGVKGKLYFAVHIANGLGYGTKSAGKKTGIRFKIVPMFNFWK